MPRRILVTGFTAFAAIEDNPSAHLAQASGVDYATFPVTWESVDSWITSDGGAGYDVLLHLGYADRHFMTPELFARNFVGHTLDVAGVGKPGDIEAGGPLLLAATLWTPEFLGDLLLDDRLRTSDDAGTYLCNYLSYRSLCAYPDKQVGFMHVPSFDRVPQTEQTALLRTILERLSSA